MEPETLLMAEIFVNASLEKTWECWIKSEHIIKWNVTGNDWMTTSAENDLRIGGKQKMGARLLIMNASMMTS